MSELTFEQMLEESFKTIRNGEVVDGTVIDVKPDEIILNIGYKADGIIMRNEYTNEPNVDLTTVVSVGDPMTVKVLKVNDGEGQVLLTYKRLAAEKGNERLKEAYEKVNDKVEIEIQTSDSTTGMQNTIDGICDIGMASRELKDSETEAGLTATVIANDGIAVVVNNDNPIDELTSDQVKSVFTGETTTWADLEK